MDKDSPQSFSNSINEENSENNDENQNQSNNKKKRSDVWPHFSSFFVDVKDVPTEYAQCIYCPW